MKNKKNLMLRLTLVSFALNIVSIVLSIFNQSCGKTAEVEKIVYQKDKTLIDKTSITTPQNSLTKDFDYFPKNTLT